MENLQVQNNQFQTVIDISENLTLYETYQPDAGLKTVIETSTATCDINPETQESEIKQTN